MTYCCAMREKFLLGIVAERQDVPTPIQAVDFIDFEAQRPDGKPVIRIRFCPFCGQPVAGPLRTMEGG